jgi:endonuclease YncB( thermonuclease family)
MMAVSTCCMSSAGSWRSYAYFHPAPVGLHCCNHGRVWPVERADVSALEEIRPSCIGLEPGPARSVTRIIDGETAALDDGTELRLIGSLAPRAIDAGTESGTWQAEIAATEELRALLLGKSVELAFGGERSDRYGRIQAQAYVREGEERRWVQGHLLEQGLARAYALAGNRACADALLAAERDARAARRGLWGEAAYQVRPAGKPSDLLRYRSTFQVVEGRIAGVAQVRGTIYLNFDADWRRAFSVSLRRGDRGLLGPNAGDPKALEGKLVRVRGWIEQRHGPTIELSTAGLIEVLDELGSGAAATRPLPGGPGAGPRPGAPQGPDQKPPEPAAKPPGLVETGRR